MIRLPIDQETPGRGFRAAYQDDSHPAFTLLIESSTDHIVVPGAAFNCRVRWMHVYHPGGMVVIAPDGVYREMTYMASACLN